MEGAKCGCAILDRSLCGHLSRRVGDYPPLRHDYPECIPDTKRLAPLFSIEILPFLAHHSVEISQAFVDQSLEHFSVGAAYPDDRRVEDFRIAPQSLHERILAL